MKDSDLPPLTAEETEAALLEGRRKKFHRLKHADYWAAKESIKKGPVKQLMK